MSSEAVAFYHSLLQNATLAGDSQALLDTAMEKQNLLGSHGRPLCNVLRPRFLSTTASRLISHQSRLLSEAVRTIHRTAIESAEFRAAFQLCDWEEQLLNVRSGYSAICPISRFDGFLSSDGDLKFCELNAQSPAGAAYSDALAAIFPRLPVMREFVKRFPCSRASSVAGVLASLLSAYRDWAGNSSEKPRIAIVDWADVPTRQEFVLLHLEFEKAGFRTVVATPEQLEFAHGKLHANGLPVTLVYRRVLLGQLVEKYGLDHPLLHAARTGAACVVNPLSGRLLGKKGCFAILSDDEHSGLFTPPQLAAIRETIPWTRFVRECHTMLDGQLIDLIPELFRNRSRFVLKPNDSYGGESVVLGWMTTPSEWEEAVAVAMEKPFVVQERIPLPREAYPIFHGHELRLAEFQQDTCPFVGSDDATFGCMTRLSTNDRINVASGSSLVPTFELAQ